MSAYSDELQEVIAECNQRRRELSNKVDRLTAERDRLINQAEAAEDARNMAIQRANNAWGERDAAREELAKLREQINAIVATAESYEASAQDPQLETSVIQERIGFAQDIYQALGIEVQP